MKHHLHSPLRVVGAWLLATLVAYTAASVAHSSHVLSRLIDLDIAIDWSARLRMVLGDWIGLYLYALIIGVGLAIAFTVMGLIGHWWPRLRTFRYQLGGALAMLTLLMLMRVLIQITPIAGARGLSGLLWQLAAGALGGWAFALISSNREKATGSV